ncbi:MAG: hypothetical protein NVS4B12_20910 [Ktedonobacteraceae bacterium]
MFAGLVVFLHKQRYRGVEGRLPTHLMCVLGFLLMGSLCLAGCAGLNFGASPTPTTKMSIATATATATATPQVALADLHWCGKPVLVFRDEGSTKSGTPTAGATPSDTMTPGATPTTLTDWKQVEPNLGFTVFLPQTLPQGSCLISASGTIHDPTFGGIFTIGYVLPNHDAISLSEAPLASQNSAFQCSVSSSAGSGKNGTPTPGPAPDPIQLCTGAHSTTNIVLSARGATATLQQLFSALQPHVSWIPAA